MIGRLLRRTLALAIVAATLVALLPQPARALGVALTPDEINRLCTQEIAGARVRLAALLADTHPRTFATTVLPYEALLADVNDRLAAPRFLALVSPDPAVRTAATHCANASSDIDIASPSGETLYAALLAARKNSPNLDAVDRKLEDVLLDDVVRSGGALDESRRRRFVKLQAKLVALQTHYRENLAGDETTLVLPAEHSAGLSGDFLSSLRRDGNAYLVPVDDRTWRPMIATAADGAVRHAYWTAFYSRSHDANAPIVHETLGVRDAIAAIFGYGSWAAYVLGDRMAQTPDHVRTFLEELDARSLPVAKAEIATLSRFARERSGKSWATLEPWDVDYVDSQYKRAKYHLDPAEIRAYFPAQRVIDATLERYGHTFGLRFTPAHGEVWGPEVERYTVADAQTNRTIGEVAFDPYAREGKVQQPGTYLLLPERRLADGSTRPAFAVVVTSWLRPGGGRPVLLAHRDVAAFLHEFGHAMASVLAATPYETLNRGFRWDYTEMPSQLLENWAWDPQTLRAISSNVRTGAPIPESLARRIIAARSTNAGIATTRQIVLALADLTFHTMNPETDTLRAFSEVNARYGAFPLAEGARPDLTFAHLMNGYDAGYYAYLWSSVYAQDLFTRFKSQGLTNPAVGLAFRHEILEPARSVEPDVAAARFLGRTVTPGAFYRQIGVVR